MKWHFVTIRNSDVAKISAVGLMNKFNEAYRIAGIPADVEVYHCRDADDAHIYYFSPQAFKCAATVLSEFYAVACSNPPDLRKCRMVPI